MGRGADVRGRGGIDYDIIYGIIAEGAHCTGAREKRRQKVERNPRQVRFDDLDALLRAYGFQVRQPGRGGSHYYYSRGTHVLSVPKRRPHLKEYVVRRALAMLGEIEAEEVNADEDKG